MAKKRAAKDMAVIESSGNVFADLGFAQPEEELTKAQLASQLRQILRRRRLTQTAAAELMGIDQPKVSALLNGRIENFSSERLMRLLTALGHDVEITVADEPRLGSHGRISVSSAMAHRQSLAVGARGFAEKDQDFIEAVSDHRSGNKRQRR